VSRLSGHFVYIVQCADGTLYTGYARDPRKRERAHNTGRGARYTSGRRPVVLVYAERRRSVGDALRRERELKRWSREEKKLLIATFSGHPPSTRKDRSRPDAGGTRQKTAKIKASALATMLKSKSLEIRP
jgi:putative endonuclease